jgi:formamidopyrimidine-DNA glycosylase
MPELPEVETVTQGIRTKLINKKIKQVSVYRRDLRFSMDTKFEKKVIGAKINNVSRRAKYILIQLDNNITLIIHLGMSGRIAIENLNNNERIFKHTHLEFITSNKKKLKYIDPRRFGSILICQTNNLYKHKLLKNLAPEPLSSEFCKNYLLNSLKFRKTNIKSIIMNQLVVVGVGNIYASESLYKAKIKPNRIAKSLTSAECDRLVKSIKKSLNAQLN